MANNLSHTKWLCKFIPKYRIKVMYYNLRANIQGYIRDLCKWRDVEILEGHMMPDYTHLLFKVLNVKRIYVKKLNLFDKYDIIKV